MKRAKRRHETERLKKNRKEYHTARGMFPNSEKIIAKYVNTPTPCSCHMCGNPRKYNRGKNAISIQEQKQKSICESID